MSTFKVQKVEFEPPIKGEPVKPFTGWVCVGLSDNTGLWCAGCDTDSADDAYNEASIGGLRELMPHTVQMFRVDPA